MHDINTSFLMFRFQMDILMLLMARSKTHLVDLILVDCLDGNLVVSCFDAQNIIEWNIFKFEY